MRVRFLERMRLRRLEERKASERYAEETRRWAEQVASWLASALAVPNAREAA